jgi:hypothetical protein
VSQGPMSAPASGPAPSRPSTRDAEIPRG